MAQGLKVDEADFLLLLWNEMNTYASFYFKTPSLDALETFLREEIYPFMAKYGDPGTDAEHEIEWHMRWRIPDPRTEYEWLQSNAAAALRQLWAVSKQQATKDTAQLSEEIVEGQIPKKLDMATTKQLRAQAEKKGMDMSSPHSQPGPQCLAKVRQNFATGNIPRYQKWEVFTSADDESRAERMGIKPRDAGYKMISDDGIFRPIETGSELIRSPATDALAMQEVLLIRAHACAMLGVVDVADYRDLTCRYMQSLRQRCPFRMRNTTINEVKWFDRQLHEDIYNEMLKDDQASLSDGLKWYLNNPWKMWNMLEPQLDTLPDQGIEKSDIALTGAKRKQFSIEDGRELFDGASRSRLPQGTCHTCGLTREEHASRQFCPLAGGGSFDGKNRRRMERATLTPAFGGKGGGGGNPPRQSSKGKGKGPAEPRTQGKGKGDRRNVPEHLKGAAGRLAPDVDHPSGQIVCYQFHDPAGNRCENLSCNFAHKCPAWLPSGLVCSEGHRIQNHTH
jgi:hypothetical protein